MGYKQIIRESLEGVKADYANDIEAMSHEALTAGIGASARLPYDFTYEVVVVNDRITNGLKGIESGPWPFEGWAVAPDEFKSPEKAASEIKRSVDDLVVAWDALSESDVLVETTHPSGNKSTPLGMALMCIQHMSYHDAQLNYVQAMNGDMEVHWK